MDTASENDARLTGMDKDTEDFLAGIAASKGPAWEDMTIEQAREGLKAAMEACAAPAPGVAGKRDISIPGAGGDITLRIYTPRDIGTMPAPVVLLLHGGGWCLGDLDCYDNFTRCICAGSECLVVSVDYRLAPEHKFPAGLEDCTAALLWLQENASEIGGDPQRIAALGDSSGANLAAAVCHMVDRSQGQQPAAQVLLCPFLDLRADAPYPSRETFGGGDYYISGSSIAWTIDHYLTESGEAETGAASPVLAKDFAGQPKALIVTAGYDPLKDEGETYAQKLASASVPVNYRCFESTIHGFLTFDDAIATGREGNTFVADWLKANL